jgi:hypothetical protein
MKKIIQSIIILISGMLASYIVNTLSNPQKQKNKDKFMASFDRVDWDAISQKVFGRRSHDVRQQLEEALTGFQRKLGHFRDDYDQAKEKHYDQLVDDFTKKLEHDADFTKNQIKKLGEYLRSDFKTMANLS